MNNLPLIAVLILAVSGAALVLSQMLFAAGQLGIVAGLVVGALTWGWATKARRDKIKAAFKSEQE